MTGWAQPASPRVGYVYPAGGKAGTSFKVTVGGQYLAGVSNVYFSGTGVNGVVESYWRPLTQKEFTALREKMKELQDKRAVAVRTSRNRRQSAGGTNQVVWTAMDEQSLAKIREKLANAGPRRQANPAIAEQITLRVTISPGIHPGARELRLVTPMAVSSPLVFKIGNLTEYAEHEPSANPELAERGRNRAPAPSGATQPELTVSLPATVNGQITPGDVDRFRFHARQGMQVVVAASARELIPYLPDAVPGWFQATLALYDSRGKEIAYQDDFRFSPDPVMAVQIPRDGDYVVEIKDSIYRGREDFVYRIAIGEFPFITGVFPLGGRVGVTNTVNLYGWNLRYETASICPAEEGIQTIQLTATNAPLNSFSFAASDLPEICESEAKETAGSAQRVSLGLTINGKIERAGDTDAYEFEAQAGQRIVAQVLARRLNSPLDAVLRLTDSSGAELAFNDDFEDKGRGLTTHHADPELMFEVPSAGTYRLHIADAQRKGGVDYGYRLRLSEPRPDFELRAVPSSLMLRGGGAATVTVYALRKDGFTNDITVSVKNAPPGLRLSGGRIPGGQDKVQITISGGAGFGWKPVPIELEGSALIKGGQITRPVVPAEDMMQAFFYRHLVPGQELLLAGSGRFGSRAVVTILSETPVKIPAGGTASVRLASATATGGPYNLRLDDPPEGIKIEKVSATRGGVEIVFASDAQKCRAGLKGNLIISAVAPGKGSAGSKGKNTTKQKPGFSATLPAIPFEVISQQASR